MITREDLANKKIDKLESIEQAKEMINLLEELNLTNHKVLVCVKELTDNVCLAARN